MNTFLSESFQKPKLTEKKLLYKIINEQNNKISFETKSIIFFKNLLKKNWQIIICILIIILCFYWRYSEVKYIRIKKKKYTDSDYESESESNSDYDSDYNYDYDSDYNYDDDNTSSSDS